MVRGASDACHAFLVFDGKLAATANGDPVKLILTAAPSMIVNASFCDPHVWDYYATDPGLVKFLIDRVLCYPLVIETEHQARATTGEPMAELRLITTSRLKVWQACPQKHHLKFRMRLAPATEQEGEPLRFGRLWHFLAEWFFLYLQRNPFYVSSGYDTAIDSLQVHSADAFDREKARALFAGYNRRWFHEHENIKVHAVEVEFRIPLINPSTGRRSRRYELGGKIDAIVEILSGPDAGLYVMEHKTSSEDIALGSFYWRRLRLDDQITIYIDGARALGYPVRGVIYDVAQRPDFRPAKATPPENRLYTKAKPARPSKPCKSCKASRLAEAKAAGEKLLVRDIFATDGCGDCEPPREAEPSRLYSGQRETDETYQEFFVRVNRSIVENPDRYFVRQIVVRLEDELARMRQNIWNQVQELLRDERRDWHPLHTSSCGDFHRLCDFFDLCTGDADANDPTRFVQRRKAHFELSEDTQKLGA